MTIQFVPSRTLRLALVGDAIASGATGLLLAGGAGLLTALLGLPEQLLRYAGLFLLPYAAIVAWVGTRGTVSRAAVRTIIVVNTLWVIESLALLIGSWVAPTYLGYAFVVAQAVVVGAFAVAQLAGLRRSTSNIPAHA